MIDLIKVITGFTSRSASHSNGSGDPSMDARAKGGPAFPTATGSKPEELRGAGWQDKATYGAVIAGRLLKPLQEAARSPTGVPMSLQREVLRSLSSYFAMDKRERAPTVIVEEAMAEVFHDLVREVMTFIQPETIEWIGEQEIDQEVVHALWSYTNAKRHSLVFVDAFDYHQGLVRLSYYFHASRPTEAFLIDGQLACPAYEKQRGCHFFRRLLMRQRIVWLPASNGASITVLLDGAQVEVRMQSSAYADGLGAEMKTGLLPGVRLSYPRGKGNGRELTLDWNGIKARALHLLASVPLVAHEFANAYIFADRESDADDNAEHLYRWVRDHHPEINAWFLLDSGSPDWDRLLRDGFRLVPPGLRRKLLLLNGKHVISSHLDNVFGGFDPSYYGRFLPWRFTYLRHGVSQHDQSHWLNSQSIDLMVSASPAEYESIIGSDTPYALTEKEVAYTGLPRHDRLRSIADAIERTQVDTVLVMPTWRAGLVDGRAQPLGQGDPAEVFAKSDYVRQWGELLRSKSLEDLVVCHGKKLVFMPHTGAMAYLSAFNLPPYVEVKTKADVQMQQLFVRAAVMITDYSSVAFEAAFLRRPVIYFQFDYQEFYGLAHNWRPGYFDYERDGFGPCVTSTSAVIACLADMLANNGQPDDRYLSRMECAFPVRDGGACRRVFARIEGLRAPYVAERLAGHGSVDSDS